ncbi:MAG: hypothetical protein QXN58_00765 [Saccharolobus sp.]
MSEKLLRFARGRFLIFNELSRIPLMMGNAQRKAENLGSCRVVSVVFHMIGAWNIA